MIITQGVTLRFMRSESDYCVTDLNVCVAVLLHSHSVLGEFHNINVCVISVVIYFTSDNLP